MIHQCMDGSPENCQRLEGRKFDAGKPPLDLLFRYIPSEALGAVGAVMAYGAVKYGERNWEDAGLSEQRLLGATLRHCGERLRGNELDESTHHHLAHAAASALMALSKAIGACGERG